MTETKNLMEGLLDEMNRVRQLITLYDDIPMGVFGATFLRNLIKRTEKAIGSGDIVEMAVCYNELKECN